MPKVSHYKSIYCFSYGHSRYMKCFFGNIQKQQNMLKYSLLFRKNTNFICKYLDNVQDSECKIFMVLFLNEPEHVVKFSNLHQCTFKFRFDSLEKPNIFSLAATKLVFRDRDRDRDFLSGRCQLTLVGVVPYMVESLRKAIMQWPELEKKYTLFL